MKIVKYTLTKYETIRRVEKVEYILEIPSHVRNKEKCAIDQVACGDYKSYKVADVVDSEMLDEQVICFTKSRVKRNNLK